MEKPKERLIFVDDIADACVFFMKKKIRIIFKYWHWKRFYN